MPFRNTWTATVLSFPRIAVLALIALVCSSCARTPPPPNVIERAAIAREMHRLEGARSYEMAEAVEIYAIRIMRRFPASPEARALREQWPLLQAQAAQQRSARLRAERWQYTAAEQGSRFQLMAELSNEPMDDAAPLRLVLRRHPRFGQSAYLLIGGEADFACALDCTLTASFDGQARHFAVRRALDNVPPALFLRDHGAFIAALEAAETLSLDVALATGDRVTYRFDIGGYQPERLQGDGSVRRSFVQEGGGGD